MIYIIGFYSFFLYVLIKAPLLYEQEQFRLRFGRLLYQWNPAAWFFGLIHLTRNLLMRYISVIFPNDADLQLTALSFIMILYLLLTYKYHPWRHTESDRTDRVLSVLTISVFLFGVNLIDGDRDVDVFRYMVVAAIIASFSLIIFDMAYVAYLFCRSTDLDKARQKRLYSLADALVKVTARVAPIELEDMHTWIRMLSRSDVARLDAFVNLADVELLGALVTGRQNSSPREGMGHHPSLLNRITNSVEAGDFLSSFRRSVKSVISLNSFVSVFSMSSQATEKASTARGMSLASSSSRFEVSIAEGNLDETIMSL